ncbi:MAG: hypothetical protein MJZ26_08890 [Fibrobacter sp.]|nr:hypothetical protein [Fibrobacter sp.]
MIADKNTPAVVARFFLALQTLKADKVIRSVSSFTEAHGINRRNLWFIEKNPSSGMFEVGWLSVLAVDYHVNPAWLLTGSGPFYSPRWTAEKVKTCRNRAKAQEVVAESA